MGCVITPGRVCQNIEKDGQTGFSETVPGISTAEASRTRPFASTYPGRMLAFTPSLVMWEMSVQCSAGRT